MSSDGDTERAVFVQYIDPEKTAEYEELHEDVPDYVGDAMERAGVEDFRVFLRDDVAVCVMDVRDVEEYVEVMGDDPKMDEWERRANELKREGIDVEGEGVGIPFMEEIWSFQPE